VHFGLSGPLGGLAILTFMLAGLLAGLAVLWLM
jgi:hypothetical protein